MLSPSSLLIVRSHRDIAGFHASLGSIYDYWDGKRGGKRMPSRGDIDPLEMRGYLPHLMLLDVVQDPRRYVYRLVGTKEVEARGRDPTGRSVAQAGQGAAAEALVFYDQIVATRNPALLVGEHELRPGTRTRRQILGLPLSSDGRIIDMILVIAHTEWTVELG